MLCVQNKQPNKYQKIHIYKKLKGSRIGNDKVCLRKKLSGTRLAT